MSRAMKKPGMARQSLSEHEAEVIPGLPGPLPAGETLLWQGSPRWWSLARSMHVRELAVYFGAITVIRGITAWNGDVLGDAVTVLELLGVSSVALSMVCLFAWMSARGTIYSVTDRRVVLRCGVALPKAVNIPFSMVASASLRAYADGTGDLSVKLDRAERVPYLMLWPHVRPWKFWPSQPTFRSIPNAAPVAQMLSRALAAATGGQVEALAVGEKPRDHALGGAVTA